MDAEQASSTPDTRRLHRNYARYLKLDADKILTDYNTQRLYMSRNKRAATEQQTYQTFSTKAAPPTGESETRNKELAPVEIDKTFFLKIGLILAGTLAL